MLVDGQRNHDVSSTERRAGWHGSNVEIHPGFRLGAANSAHTLLCNVASSAERLHKRPGGHRTASQVQSVVDGGRIGLNRLPVGLQEGRQKNSPTSQEASRGEGSERTERVGFEPTDPCGSPVFKTARNHCNHWGLSGHCLAFCLYLVELCRAGRPTSTLLDSRPREPDPGAACTAPLLKSGRTTTAAS